MGFFSRNRTAAEEEEYCHLANFMLDIGGITDAATREICFGGLASLRSSARREALEIEKTAPGYRQELNKLRAQYGLPPI